MGGRFVADKQGQQALLDQVTRKAKANMERAVDYAVGQARGRAPRRTGLLITEIDGEVVLEDGAVVGRVGVKKRKKGGAFYWRFLELGTRKMAAKPFLRPALFSNLREIARILGVKR